jgi:uncharacterized protein YcbX
MSRFRPNIVLDGLPAWSEDRNGTKLTFGNGQVLAFLKPCDRCKVTTIDQEEGTTSKQGQPLKTLRAFRKLTNKVDVFFATNAVLVSEESVSPLISGELVKVQW